MTIHLSALLPALCTHAGVDLADALAPIRQAFWAARGMPRDFRSEGDAPSMAGSMRNNGTVLKMPVGLPYMAGVACGDNVRLTGVELAPGALWYGDTNEAKLVLKRTSLPLTIIGGMAGQRIGAIVGHPALAMLDDTVIAVTENDGHTTFRTTLSGVRMDDPLGMPTPRCSWNEELEDMEARQGLRERRAA